jgi:predicted nucleotidyltransferase
LKVKETGKVLQEIIQVLKEHQEELKEKYKVKRLKIFGSYVKNKQMERSTLI